MTPDTQFLFYCFDKDQIELNEELWQIANEQFEINEKQSPNEVGFWRAFFFNMEVVEKTIVLYFMSNKKHFNYVDLKEGQQKKCIELHEKVKEILAEQKSKKQ